MMPPRKWPAHPLGWRSTIETHFWPDAAAAFAELFRVWKPQGRLAAVLQYTRDGNDPDQMALLEQHAGFVKVKVSFVPAKKWLYVEGARPTATAIAR